MAVTLTYFTTPNMLRWSWPLKLAVCTADGSPATQKRPEVDPRFSKLVEWLPWPDEQGRVNMLICFSSPWELLRQVHDGFPGYQPVPVLLLISDTPAASDPENPVEAKLAELAYIFGANGVFCLDAQTLSWDWLTGLVVELSHNKSLPEALSLIAPEGHFFYDPKLEEETKIRHYIRGIIEGLRIFSKNKSYKITNRLVGRQKAISGSDLADMLETQLPSMGFNHESDEATDTAELTRVLTKDDDPIKFNINNDQFQYLRSAPPEFSAGDEPQVKMVDNAEPAADSARYLQAQIEEKGQSGNPVSTHLLPYRDYFLFVRIGLEDASWLQGTVPVPDTDLFKSEQVEAEFVEVVFMNNISGQTLNRQLVLPPGGNSRPVRFSIRTEDADTPLDGLIYLYHKGRLFQEASIYAEVAESNANNHKIEVTITQCLRRNLSGQEGTPRSEFGSSIQYDPSGHHGGEVSGLIEGAPFSVRSLKGLDGMVDRLRRWVESAAVNPDTYTEDLFDEDNQKLLRILAFHGSELYSNWVEAGRALTGPIQVVQAREAYLPVEFIYTLPCPDANAPLCTNARDALLAGKCQQCCDLTQKPAPCVCPFGFVGLREVIERSGGIIPPESEPDARQRAIPVLERSLYAATEKVAAHTPQLLEKVAEAVTQFAEENLLVETWPDWASAIEKKPTSLILLVHTERDMDLDAEKLEIGKQQFKFKTHLFKDLIRHPEAPYPPLAIVIGCRTGDIAGFGFDIGSHFLNNGAAIVFTSFTKILGRQAGPIVIRLLEFLKAHEGEERSFGEIVLQLRQYLLAHGIMAGLALVAYGDADWKIKR